MTTETASPEAPEESRVVTAHAANEFGSPAPCSSCGNAGAAAGLPPDVGAARPASPSYVYAVGRIEPRFPLMSLEKEFAQVAGRSSSKGLTDGELFQAVLSRPENRYLTQQLCWVFTVAGMDTYILYPRNPVDMEVLVGSLRDRPRATDMDVVVGVRGPVAPPAVCNGLMVPLVGFTQIYSFDLPSFLNAVPKPAKVDRDAFRSAVEEILDRLLMMADNVGAQDEHRAVNYLALRYPALYTKAYELFAGGAALDALDVHPSTVGMTRNLLDVVFSFRNRATNFVERWSAKVDVTEEFPFLATGLSAYFRS